MWSCHLPASSESLCQHFNCLGVFMACAAEKPRYILAVDQGTTSTRACLFDHSGSPVDVSQTEFPQHTNSAGWVEHDAMEIWESVVETITTVLQRNGIRQGMVAAIGITNQRETSIIWSRSTGIPFRRAIVWQDTRTADWCEKMAAARGGRDCFRQQTGLPLVPYFSASKIRWMLDNDPTIRDAADRGDAMFGTVDTWLLYKLTGGSHGGIHATDSTNAARTMLLNIDTMQWDDDLCCAFGVPQSVLPEVRTSSEVYGCVSCTQLPPAVQGTPLGSVMGDQSAALFGHAGFKRGDTKSTYGTGCFIVQNVGTARVSSQSGLLSIVAYHIKGQKPVYGLEGSVAVAGSAVQWLQEATGIIKNSRDIEAVAASVQDNGGVTFVPAFTGLFAPHWRADARGTICGLTRATRPGHIARATLESTALQCRELVHAMAKESEVPVGQLNLHVDGGMCVNDSLMQWQATLAGVRVCRPVVTETTAAGAAFAAGLAVGFWDDTDQILTTVKVEREFLPDLADPAAAGTIRAWEKGVERSFGWVERNNDDDSDAGALLSTSTAGSDWVYSAMTAVAVAATAVICWGVVCGLRVPKTEPKH